MQEELIQEFKNGNRQAGDDYYTANYGLVCSITNQYSKLRMDKEEVMAIVNQAFAYSLKKVDLKKAMFSTYFSVIARGMLLRHFRDCERNIRTQRSDEVSKKIVHCDSIDKVIFESNTENITIGHIISSTDDCTAVFVNEALNKVNEKDRVAFKLQLFQGLTQTQIAEMLGTGQVEVSRRINRAKERLRLILKDVC